MAFGLPNKSTLAINRATARRLGLETPNQLLIAADIVVD